MTEAKKQCQHRWGDKAVLLYKSERECLRGCGVVKVVQHEPTGSRTEYWRDMERISTGKAPPCEAVP